MRLPHSGGNLLERQIPGSDALDAMGPSPIFGCRRGSAPGADPADLSDRRTARKGYSTTANTP